MPTTNVMNSTLMALYVGGTKVAHSNDASLSINHEPRDITTKDSAGYRELLEGLRSWSASAGALYAEDAAYGYDDLKDAFVNRTALTVRLASSETGDTYIEGSAYLSSLELNSAGQEENVSFSVSFEGTGTLTFGTVS